MIFTPICELLGIALPILQGGMAYISDECLAAAVSEAGGLGILSAADGNAEALSRRIDALREKTQKPFGVNVMLRSENIAALADVIAQKHVPIVTTGAGDPSVYMPQWKAAGCKVIPVVASSTMAKWMQRCGADAVIAEGGESGGHIGEMHTMALIPQVCDAVSIPVIAAGGIADGRGMAAALMLGAVGVQMGTRFLAAKECNICEIYKQKVLQAGDRATIVTGSTLGHPVRSLKTMFSRQYAKAERNGADAEALESMAKGSLLAALQGDGQQGCFLAGEAVGMVNAEASAKEIMEELIKQAESCFHGGTAWVK